MGHGSAGTQPVPGSPPAGILATAEMMNQMKPRHLSANLPYARPGTRMGEQVEQEVPAHPGPQGPGRDPSPAGAPGRGPAALYLRPRTAICPLKGWSARGPAGYALGHRSRPLEGPGLLRSSTAADCNRGFPGLLSGSVCHSGTWGSGWGFSCYGGQGREGVVSMVSAEPDPLPAPAAPASLGGGGESSGEKSSCSAASSSGIRCWAVTVRARTQGLPPARHPGAGGKGRRPAAPG